MTARPRSASSLAQRNARGNTADRRRRKLWLLDQYRADVAVYIREIPTEPTLGMRIVWPVEEDWIERHCAPEMRRWWRREPTTRCYRCGTLLTYATLTVDRIMLGCKGGRYVRSNIRPACSACNIETGSGRRGND